MPSIETASTPVSFYPNEFSSPYGNDGIVPLYSSVPLKSPVAGCLPCVVCGDSIVRNEIIANSGQNKIGVSGVIVTPVKLLDWTTSVDNPCDINPWIITNNGRSLRYNITDSMNCGGTCDSIQSGEATAVIFVSSKAKLNLDFFGIVEWQNSGYESLKFYLNGVLIASADSREEHRGCGYFGPPISNYIIQPPYFLEPNVNYSLLVKFTTGDPFFHLGCYYQVDLSITFV